MHTWLPALLAMFAAAFIAGGTVLRQRESCAGGGITVGWCVGAAVALCGFGLQAAALGLGSILLVQPLVVLAVLFALPLEAWLDHRHPSRVEWAWGGVLVACVAVFLLVADPHEVDRKADHVLIAGTIVALITLVAILIVAAERSSPHYQALLYGLVAGTLFGISALLVKAVIYQAIHDPVNMTTRPEVYLFVVVAVGGVVAQQRGFVAGDLQTSFPAMTVMEPAVSMALGVTLLGESVAVGWWQTAVMAIALLVMVRAVITLARMSAVRGDQRPEVAPGVTRSAIGSTVDR